MENLQEMIAFGPVPSRRLGRSLGVNNIPPKNCTYSCIYCQVGNIGKIQFERRELYRPEIIAQEVEKKVKKIMELGESIDYLAFVPDGEPTLDIHLGDEIDLLRPFGVKIGVISNASLIWREDVRRDLMKADWVSLKVDAVDKKIWRRINRPHRDLQLPVIQEGMLQFAREYTGELVTETMLVKNVNDSVDHIKDVANFLSQLRPTKAYLSIPTRPPAEKRVHPPSEEMLNAAYQILSSRLEDVECLFGYEGNAFSLTGNVEADLLGIVAVHPMREEAVREFLTKAGKGWSLVQNLIYRNLLFETEYEGQKYFMRRLDGKEKE
ncbi:MAG: radical SAM protein [Thermodesulfobacteriota bacterium]|nr:radical SAM protein [Thermodesulfobacteriota bacterium]